MLEDHMADLIDVLAFYGLIAAQFLAVVVAYQHRTGFPAWHDINNPKCITLIRRVA
jgi:hypothetical protein